MRPTPKAEASSGSRPTGSIWDSDRMSRNAKRPIVRALFAAGLDHELLREIRSSTHGGYAIGDARFREQLEHALQQRATPRGPGRPARREDQ